MALPLSQSFYGFLQAPLRFEMKQETVAAVNAFQRLATISVLAVGLNRRFSAIEIAFSMLSVYVLFYFVWKAQSKKVIESQSVTLAESFHRIKRIMGGMVIWIHLNGVITNSILTLDLFFLNTFRTPLEEIGKYSLALKTANFFQLVPIAIVSSFGVYLGKHQHESDHSKERALLNKLGAGYVLLSSGALRDRNVFG